jgi:hypothetical protein
MVTCGEFLDERVALRAMVRAESLVTGVEPRAMAVGCGGILRVQPTRLVDPTLTKPAIDLT